MPSGNRSGNASGIQKQELININRSLMNLGRCLEGLRHNQRHQSSTNQRAIPFRDSQITMLFKDSLLGDGDTVMIATANPRPADFDETVHAMRYTSIAREIKIHSKVDTHHKPKSTASRLHVLSTLKKLQHRRKHTEEVEVLSEDDEAHVMTPGIATFVFEAMQTRHRFGNCVYSLDV